MSPEEFSEFMRQRFLKRMEENPGKPPCCIGSIFPSDDFPDAKLVECCRCGIPLYVLPGVFEEMQKYRLPWDETKVPYFCMFCVPPEKFRGAYVQDIAAVLQQTGEK
jgi:hypothetical protein